jgi:hypothetical protein
MIQAIEQEEMQAAAKTAEANRYADVSDRVLARALAVFIQRTRHKRDRDGNSG